MSHYRMIFLDIDGTLLNSHHKITLETERAVKAAVSRDVPVVLVSARAPYAMREMIDQLGLWNMPLASYSGALILSGLSDPKVLFESRIAASDACAIWQCAKEAGVHTSVYSGFDWFVEEMDPWAVEEQSITHLKTTVGPFAPLFHQGLTPHKVQCLGPDDKIDALCRQLNAHYQGAYNIYPSKSTNLEIMSPQASKVSAVRFLCDHFSLSPSQIIAAGDNYNDTDMIAFAGMGVAMGNAPDDVKEKANYVTASNDEDGVAKMIHHFIG